MFFLVWKENAPSLSLPLPAPGWSVPLCRCPQSEMMCLDWFRDEMGTSKEHVTSKGIKYEDLQGG